jgi:hypothetical protein
MLFLFFFFIGIESIQSALLFRRQRYINLIWSLLKEEKKKKKKKKIYDNLGNDYEKGQHLSMYMISRILKGSLWHI